MTAYTENRVDTTVALAVALRLTHRAALEVIAEVHPKLLDKVDTLTRAESMAVAEKVNPSRTLEVLKSLRSNSL